MQVVRIEREYDPCDGCTSPSCALVNQCQRQKEKDNERKHTGKKDETTRKYNR
jgi:hypothetical protein